MAIFTNGIFPKNGEQGHGGGIIQVKQTIVTQRVTYNGSSFAEIGQLDIGITPQSSSNKVLIMVTSDYYVPSGTGGAVSIFRGSTNRGHSTNGFGVVDDGGGGMFSIIYEDEPNSTSQQTYTLKSIRVNGSGSFDIPRDPSKEPALMTLFEVAP